MWKILLAIIAIVLAITFPKRDILPITKMKKSPPKLYHAFVIGANGAVGKALVKELLASNSCGKVTAMGRKTLTESDFGEKKNDKFDAKLLNYDDLDEKSFVGYDVGFNTIGSTIKQAGSEEAFYKIDYTYPTTIAKMAQKNGTKYVY
jgi:nucleoside-diphosphate-sugar epimerase